LIRRGDFRWITADSRGGREVYAGTNAEGRGAWGDAAGANGRGRGIALGRHMPRKCACMELRGPGGD
jgi:hypothetical protein